MPVSPKYSPRTHAPRGPPHCGHISMVSASVPPEIQDNPNAAEAGIRRETGALQAIPNGWLAREPGRDPLAHDEAPERPDRAERCEAGAAGEMSGAKWEMSARLRSSTTVVRVMTSARRARS